MNRRIPILEYANERPKGSRLRTLVARGLLCWLVAIFGFTLLTMPESDSDTMARMSRKRCITNLKMLHAALRRYASEHQDTYPDDLVILASDGYIDYVEIAACPETLFDARWNKLNRPLGNEETAIIQNGYRYFGAGVKVDDSRDVVVVADVDDDHRGRVNVLWLSGRIETLRKSQAQEAIARPGGRR